MTHCTTCYQHDGKHIPECPGGKRRSKYGNQKTVVDGFTFDSKKEADYYSGLRLARDSGDLLFFLRQVPFHLPGGVVYRCDFAEFWKNEVRFVDVKGMRTREFINKKKQVEALYGVAIFEV